MYRASHIQSPTSYPHLSSLGSAVSLFLRLETLCMQRCATRSFRCLLKLVRQHSKALHGQADPAKVEFAVDQDAVVADPAWYATSAPVRVQPPSHGEQHLRKM